MQNVLASIQFRVPGKVPGVSWKSRSPIKFQRDFFENDNKLDAFVSQCDVIVHLAAMNRHESQEVIYETNVNLVEKLVASYFI